MSSPAWAMALAAGVALPLPSCATAPSDEGSRAVRSAAAIESPARRLQALAELEAFEPNRSGVDRAAEVIDPSLPRPLGTGDPGFADASRPLESILEELRPARPVGTIEAPEPEDAAEAARLYTRSRAARLADDARAAIEMLERAVDLDPGAAVLWRELGEARYSAGDRVGAVDAWQASAELGDTEARPLLLLASDAAQRGDAGETVRWAGAAWVRGEESSPERLVAGSMLGTALIERGNFRAGAEVLGRTLEGIGRRRPAPGDSGELTRLRVRSGELSLRLGDAWARLGQPGRAAEAYAAGLSGDDRVSVPMLQRALAAMTLDGRPATAATLLLEHLSKHAGDLGVEESQWLRGLCGLKRVGDAVSASVSQLITDPARTDTQRRQLLRTLVRAVPDDASAVDAALAFPELSAHPVVAGDLMLRLEPADRLPVAVRSVGASARAWAAALARLDPAPAELASRLLASSDPAERALGVGVCAEYANSAPIGSVGWTPKPSEAAMLADLLGRAGRWDEASRMLEASVGATPSDRMAALIGCQRLDESMALGDTIAADPNATVDGLLAAAEIAFIMNDAAKAEARVIRAGEIDPFDERVWERRVALVSAEGASPDEVRSVGRSLAERRGRSALFGLLRARDLAAQGRNRDACELVAALNDREPARDLGLTMLSQFAAAGAEQAPGLVDFASRWLAERQRRLPGSVPGTLAWAQVLAVDSPARALEVLDRASQSTGHPEVARAAESLLRSATDLGERAEDRVLERTQGINGVDASLERMEACLRVGRWAEAVEACSAALPPDGRLTPHQAEQWRAAAGALSRLPEDAGVFDRVLRVYDEGEARGLLDDALVRQRALVLARLGQVDRLRSLLATGALGDDGGIVVVQALFAAGRQPEGIDLLGTLALAGDSPDAELLSEWGRLVGAGGDADRVRALYAEIDRRDDAALLAEVAISLRETYGFNESPGESSPQRHRADIAYTAALVANVFNRVPESEAMYRLAIEQMPDHAWACNDLGYGLADRGESLDEAEALIERAAAVLPNEASVLDSLGWVRYKLGVFEDERDADGNVVREGAISLLTRAVEADDGPENATLQEHLGDALWRAGRVEPAAEAWRTAERLLRSRAMELASQAQPNQTRIAETQDRMNQVRRRLEAVERGADPPVAPIGPGIDAPDPG